MLNARSLSQDLAHLRQLDLQLDMLVQPRERSVGSERGCAAAVAAVALSR